MKKKGSNTDQENKASAAASSAVNGGQIVTQHSNGPTSGGAGSQTAVGGSTSKPMSAVEMEANWNSGGKEAYRAMMLANK